MFDRLVLRPGPVRLLLVLAGAVTAVGAWQTVRGVVACRALGHRQAQLVAQRQARVLPLQAPAAPFVTWAHLVAALHQVAAAVPLVEISYRTGEVLAITPGGPPTGPVTEDDEGLRAMTATVRGRGSYDQIVAFVAALAGSDPPLEILRLRIEAAPAGPRFAAEVYALTALPIREPVLVGLADEGDEVSPR